MGEFIGDGLIIVALVIGGVVIVSVVARGLSRLSVANNRSTKPETPSVSAGKAPASRRSPRK